MDKDDFARSFEHLYRLTFIRAARRIRDKRERMAPETLGLLEHLAQAGPVTLGELTVHLDRAASTLSEMLDPLISRGWIERDRDPADGRRYLLWLSPTGQAARVEEQKVLDCQRLAASAQGLAANDRQKLIDLLDKFVRTLGKDDHDD